MAAVAAAIESDLQAAAAAGLEPAPTPAAAAAAADARPLATLHPRLLMAARRGNSRALKDLLQLKEDDGNGDEQGQGSRPDDEGSGTPTAAAAPAASTTTSVAAAPSISPPHAIVDVDPRRPHDDAVAAPLHDDDAPALPARQPPPPAAAPAGHSAVPVVLDEDGVTIQGDSLLHVVAAGGDTQEFLDCVDVIVRTKEKKSGAGGKRRALEARNNKGDTPLHCAAGAGNAHMMSCLLAALITSTTDDDNEEAGAAAKKTFLRMQNECGETALHQAVRAASNKVPCIDRLMDLDPELACIPHEDGASPLYLAIELGELWIAQHLYDKSKGNLSYSGPDGRNVLHAAVHRDQALPMILEWLKKDTKPNEDSSSVSLVSQLTSQRDKQQKGSTPLHLAASLEGWSTRVRFSRSRQARLVSMSATALLLDANLSTAYQADDEGWYPIHVAAHARSLDVVKLLLGRCPDCATLRDGKGRTFLHVAAEERRHHAVVQYVCGEMPQRSSSMILNAQDSNGDTALHGAVRAGNLAVFNCLFRNQRVRLDVANKDGMTPLDLSYTMIPAGFYYGLNPRTIVHKSLLAAGTPHGGERPELFLAKHISKGDLDKESKKHTEATQVTSIVTALIATVTFASAFTLPGGYRSADGGDAAAATAGTPVLAGRYAFDAFILADTLAFIYSIAATCTLVFAGLPAMDISLRNWYFNLSAVFLQSAARSLVAAFGLALYLVLAPVDHETAVAVCVITFASSLYGNMGAWRIIRMATTVCARTGSLRPLPAWAQSIFHIVLVHFGSYVIIFGLPAIRKRVH